MGGDPALNAGESCLKRLGEHGAGWSVDSRHLPFPKLTRRATGMPE